MFELCLVVSGPPLSMPGRTSYILYKNTRTCLDCQISYDDVVESNRTPYINRTPCINSFAIRPQSKPTMVTTWINKWNLNKDWLKKLMYDYDEFWENEIYI